MWWCVALYKAIVSTSLFTLSAHDGVRPSTKQWARSRSFMIQLITVCGHLQSNGLRSHFLLFQLTTMCGPLQNNSLDLSLLWFTTRRCVTLSKAMVSTSLFYLFNSWLCMTPYKAIVSASLFHFQSFKWRPFFYEWFICLIFFYLFNPQKLEFLSLFIF